MGSQTKKLSVQNPQLIISETFKDSSKTNFDKNSLNNSTDYVPEEHSLNNPQNTENTIFSFSSTTKNNENVTFDFDISDYYSESIITIRIHLKNLINSRIICEKKMTLKDFFSSTEENNNKNMKKERNESNKKKKKKWTDNSKSEKNGIENVNFGVFGHGTISHPNDKILKIFLTTEDKQNEKYFRKNFPIIPTCPSSTTSSTTFFSPSPSHPISFLSSFSSYLNRITSNLSKKPNNTADHKLEKPKLKSENKIIDTRDVHTSKIENQNVKKFTDEKFFGFSHVLISTRFLFFSSCLYVEPALGLLGKNKKSDNINNYDTKDNNNNNNNNDNDNNNSNNNNNNNNKLLKKDIKFTQNEDIIQNDYFYDENNILSKNISKMDFLSEFHFLIAYSNIYVVSTVMSVLADKGHLRSALLLTDSHYCNALDIALRRGEGTRTLILDNILILSYF